ARVVGVIDREHYTIEKVIFESQPKFYVTANLYLPKRGSPPYPAVLYPLGHERGGKSHDTWQRMLGSLATKGYIALAWDPIGQGERSQLYDADFEQRKLVRSTTEHTVLGVQCLLAGDSVARYTISDGIRALDYLLSRPEVDKTRVACTGNSGGGTHTAYLSALDDRIKVAAPSCYITSWGRLLHTIGPQDAEQILLPWISAGLDHGDFVIAFAPKPYLMLSAVRDFFSIHGARSTYSEAKVLYRKLGSAEKMSMSEVDAGHGYHRPNRLAAYEWFAQWLNGEKAEADEPEIEIAEFDELACTETGQVATSLGGETVFTLNKRRVERLDPKLPSPASGAAFRDEVRRRVRHVSGVDYKAGAVKIQPYGQIDRDGYHIEKLAYTSEPGIFVPSLLFVPEGGPARKPAIVYVHGQGKSADAGAGGDIEWFTKAGHIVLAIDLRGKGETSRLDDRNGSDWPRYFGDYDSAMTSFLIGESLVGMRAADILRGVDLLAGRDDVDRANIHGVGKQQGAVPLLYAAALDDRLKQLAFEEMLVSSRSVVEQRIHRNVLEDIVPGLLKQYDIPDLVNSLKPRKVLLINPVNPLGNRLRPAAARQVYPSVPVARRRAGEGPEDVYRDHWATVVTAAQDQQP
ncbi:MAG: prolyl oligopeptidase family serine peptidase, partial [bacterium]|nr:prolyl oligopeptidase family serine peptidase [bacterium]